MPEFKFNMDADVAMESSDTMELPLGLDEEIDKAVAFLNDHKEQDSVNIILTITR